MRERRSFFAFPAFGLAMLFLWGTALPEGLSQNQPGKPASAKKSSHGASCPKECKTCAAATEKALTYLSGKFKREGGGYTLSPSSSLAGLAFLAEGSSPAEGTYAKEVRACLDDVMTLVETENTTHPEVNWCLALYTLFLTEVYHKGPDVKTKEALIKLGRTLEQNQEKDGGWAHEPDSRRSYRSFSPVTTLCLAAMINLRRCGFAVDEVVIKRAVKYLENCTMENMPDASYNGAIAYDKESARPLPNGTFTHPSPARTGMAIYDILLLDSAKTKAPYNKWVDFFRKDMKRTLYWAHASFHLCYLYSALGAYKLGASDWKTYRMTCLDQLLATQDARGASLPMRDDIGDLSSNARGLNLEYSKGNIPDSDVYCTAILAIVLQLPKDNLVMVTGKIPQKK